MMVSAIKYTYNAIYMMGKKWPIVKQAVCDVNFVRCGRSDCTSSNCDGNLFHCHLCTFSKSRPCEIKEHFKNVHWNNRVDDGG